MTVIHYTTFVIICSLPELEPLQHCIFFHNTQYHNNTNRSILGCLRHLFYHNIFEVLPCWLIYIPQFTQ